MLNYYYNDFDFDYDNFVPESYPDYFYNWDKSLSDKQHVYFTDADELSDIIEIYFYEGNIKKAKQTIRYALKFHPDNNDLVYDILYLLNENEQWNDLLLLTEQYQDELTAWTDGHKLMALLHLGMEEDAFLFFGKLKCKYKYDHENLDIIYQAMGEALHEMDLFKSSINVIEEAIVVLNPNSDLYQLQLESYLSIEDKEKALDIAAKIKQFQPMEGEIWNHLGDVYLEMKEVEKAIDAFEVAESLNYKTQNNYLGLICAYEQNGNFQKALEKVKEYLDLYPSNYMAFTLAAALCAEQGWWKEAVTHIDSALCIVPDMDSLYLCKSKYFINLGEFGKAMAALEEGIRLTGDKEGDLQKELKNLHAQYPNK